MLQDLVATMRSERVLIGAALLLVMLALGRRKRRRDAAARPTQSGTVETPTPP